MSNLVSKVVEFSFVEGVIRSSIGFSSGSEFCNLSFGWVNTFFIKEFFDSDSKLSFVNLSVSAGINMIEDWVRISHGDAILRNDATDRLTQCLGIHMLHFLNST